MRLMKLVHPTHGLCAQVVIYGINTEKQIRHNWKFKYGKKFDECTVEIENDSFLALVNKKKHVAPKWKAKVTDDLIYEVLRLLHKKYKPKEVAIKLKISIDTVYRIQLNKKSNGGQYYNIAV